MTSQFLLGLIEGDGCFTICFAKNGKIKYLFELVGHISQIELFKKIQMHLGCGFLNQEKTILKLSVRSRKELINKIIPFMDKKDHILYTTKKTHYEIFRKIVLIDPKNLFKDFDLILNDCYNSNLGGKRRKLSLEEYKKKYSHI